MSLYEMLVGKRDPILERCRSTMVNIGGADPEARLDQGLTEIYDQLVEVIGNSWDGDSVETRHKFVNDTIADGTSRKHAQELHRQGYTISHLVRGYGSLCQAITEYALETGETISSGEFAQLNLSLDVAIAQAVSEFQHLSLASVEKSEKLKMGFLIHELRNCLSTAVMSHELVRKGQVGSDGSTSRIVTEAHNQMRKLIDQSIAEVRMDSGSETEMTVFKIVDLLLEVESSLTSLANSKAQIIYVEVGPNIQIEADRHLMISALTNLVQNAIKFTKVEGSIWLRAFLDGSTVVIEVEDRCGGLPEGSIEDIFEPYFQAGTDISGMGLGLSIARRAATINNCTISVRNLPSTGCVFTMRMPAYVGDIAQNKARSG